jgi:hypothetical protein
MSTATFRLLAIATLCVSAIIYAPLHYSWRWRQNEEQYQQGRIIKDDWVGGQILIPIEAWGLGILGGAGALFALWRITQRRRHAAS